MRDYFSFNRRERRGISVLLGILALLLIALGYMHSGDFVQGRESVLEEAQLDQKEEIRDPIKKEQPHGTSENPEEKKKRLPEYFCFNPNTTSQENWERLGLSERQAKTIINYVSKGGKFRKKEDLKKIYSIHDQDYDRLEHYILIPEDSSKKAPKPFVDEKGQSKPLVSYKIKPGEHLELNGADSAALIRLPCIGPAFARRIIAYRTRIGGFVSTEQLKEIFGFDEERFNCLSDRVEVDPDKIHKLNINVASADELKKHPYIRWNVARLIESYRKQHGPYRKLEELRKLDLIDEVLFGRILPYLSLE